MTGWGERGDASSPSPPSFRERDFHEQNHRDLFSLTVYEVRAKTDYIRRVQSHFVDLKRPAGLLDTALNSVTELLPSDTNVADIAARHLAQVDLRVTWLLQQLGLDEVDARQRSGAMLALATGAVTLRKAGQSLERIRGMLAESSAPAS